MSEKPKKRLVSKREYVKLLRDDISNFTANFTWTVMMLGFGVLMLWVAWGFVSSFRVLQSPWYAYLLPVLCVGLSLFPLFVGLISLLLSIDTPNVRTVTFIAPKTASLLPPEETLVRASAAPPSHQQAELLRGVVSPASETPPEELLRAIKNRQGD
ncbi:MAG: hypothetical protein JWL77_6463 [Chthonomonadaceae bacterium]|nr:hypothetical protein [Chthonomonadaceae bacterium]